MAMENQLPPDPINGLKEASVTMHEVYLGHVAAGFTPDQAMQLILAWYNYLLQQIPKS